MIKSTNDQVVFISIYTDTCLSLARQQLNYHLNKDKMYNKM